MVLVLEEGSACTPDAQGRVGVVGVVVVRSCGWDDGSGVCVVGVWGGAG